MSRADITALRSLPPAAAWLASRGALRVPWLRDAHAVARRAASGPPTLAAWAAVAGCSVSALTAARREYAELAALDVPAVGAPRVPGSRRERRRAAGG